ncbi:50S ribosomal protein L17 [Acidipropionibacterium virtanenii]|uniref:Large ribosomal subunit protein bL17 n=1 Tax=Acidipropionibacterium virtanenii TaxID=2057246 RepID=A0A344USB1_9ACTN|nr:50S ribosomal protein L17 [Acidipropionibacterium virtanenii]AXE38159.1 50S ribosomal protein L17 [Acidipropionibacterium virtanenii]
MPKPTKGPRIGGTPAHERIIMRNLASQLFEHGRLVTTVTKAKRVQPLAEKLINRAKKDTVANRREVNKKILDKGVVYTLFAEIAPRMEGREGGYTRITRIGNRKGDNAPMAVIEIVTDKIEASAPQTSDAAKSEINAAAAAVQAAEAAADEVEAEKGADIEETEDGAEESEAPAEDKPAEEKTEA